MSTEHTATLPPPAARRFLRKTRGLSLKAVARIIGCDYTSVSRYESGQQIPTKPHIVNKYRLLLEHLAQEAGTTLEQAEADMSAKPAGAE